MSILGWLLDKLALGGPGECPIGEEAYHDFERIGPNVFRCRKCNTVRNLNV